MQQRRILIAAACAVALLLGVVSFFFFSGSDETGLGPRLDVWAPATVPYDPACSDDCVDLATVVPGHAGASEQLTLAFNPAVDDAIAQWGDCIQSVMICRREDRGTAECVAQSACPAECRTRYADLAAGDEASQADLFQRFFVDDDGPCVPPDDSGFEAAPAAEEEAGQ